MTDQTIAAGIVRGLMELAASKGASPAALADRSGIDPAGLRDPDARVPFTKYVALMRAGKELCGDPALALHFGEEFECAEMSIVGMLGRSSETLAEGFARLNRYSRLAAEVEVEGGVGAERFRLERRGGRLWVVDTRRSPNDFPEMTEAVFARMVCAARRLFGDRPFMKAVHVTHAAPPYRAEYDRIFQLPVVFGSDRNALVTDGAWPGYRPPVPSRYAAEVLGERAEALLGRLESSKSLRGRVESLLLPVLHTGEANVDATARKLGLSRQTLFRRLKAEGVTFEKVLDELRHRLALHYLGEKSAPVNETAYLVGFSDPAAFSRAFKRWTGASPRTARAPKQAR